MARLGAEAGRIQVGREAREVDLGAAEVAGPVARPTVGAVEAGVALEARRLVQAAPAEAGRAAVAQVGAGLVAVARTAIVGQMVALDEMVTVDQIAGKAVDPIAARRIAGTGIDGAVPATSVAAVRARTDTAAVGPVVPRVVEATEAELVQAARDAAADIAMVAARTLEAVAREALKGARTKVHVGIGPTTVAGVRVAATAIVAVIVVATAAAVAVIVTGPAVVGTAVAVIVTGPAVVATAVAVIVTGPAVVATAVAVAVIAGATIGTTPRMIARRRLLSERLARYGIAPAVGGDTKPTSERCPNRRQNSGSMKVH